VVLNNSHELKTKVVFCGRLLYLIKFPLTHLEGLVYVLYLIYLLGEGKQLPPGPWDTLELALALVVLDFNLMSTADGLTNLRLIEQTLASLNGLSIEAVFGGLGSIRSV
jgi:hypothetical protein